MYDRISIVLDRKYAHIHELLPKKSWYLSVPQIYNGINPQKFRKNRPTIGSAIP